MLKVFKGLKKKKKLNYFFWGGVIVAPPAGADPSQIRRFEVNQLSEAGTAETLTLDILIGSEITLESLGEIQIDPVALRAGLTLASANPPRVKTGAQSVILPVPNARVAERETDACRTLPRDSEGVPVPVGLGRRGREL